MQSFTRHSLTLLVAALVVVGTVLAAGQSQGGASGEAEAAGRGVKLPEGPITITKVDMYRDGGTVMVEGVSKGGDDFVLCFDARMSSATLSRIYYGVSHPSQGGTMLGAGSEEERKMVAVLYNWLDRHYLLSEQGKLKGKPRGEDVSQQDRWAMLLMRAFEMQANVRAQQRWLDNNYTAEEQAAMLKHADEKSLSGKAFTAWHAVQSLNGYPARKKP